MDNNNSFSQQVGCITCACGKKLKSNAVFCSKCKRMSDSLPHTPETHTYLRELSIKSKRMSDLFFKISILLAAVAVISSLLVSYGIIPMYSYETFELEFPEYDQNSKAELGDIYALDVVKAVFVCGLERTFTGLSSGIGSRDEITSQENFYLFLDNDGDIAAFSTYDDEIKSQLNQLYLGELESVRLYGRVAAAPKFSGKTVKVNYDGIDFDVSFDDSHLTDADKQNYDNAEDFFKGFTNFELDRLPVTETVRNFGYGSAVLVLAAVLFAGAIALFVVSRSKKSYAARLSDCMTIIHRTYSTKTEE